MGTQSRDKNAVEHPVGQQARQAGDQCGAAADGVAGVGLARRDSTEGDASDLQARSFFFDIRRFTEKILQPEIASDYLYIRRLSPIH
jgi:hypothetical protein